ncbi:MAG: imidazole glycerol phosphate synthase subunit HisF [Candidatus Omnitrophica bacterium]|nr:imidazole glycerol phosphate synthase subunit HisF [Candidatus Omnitrophota bacterium]
MLKKRLIPVLILRDGVVVRSVSFTHTNIIHWKPATAVDFFNKWAVDEIVLLDVSRTLDQREKFYEAIEGLSKQCFVPLTAGGWVTSVDEARALLRLGADKITVNTEAVRRPAFITECATVFGSQCVVVSIDVRRATNAWKVSINRGSEATGLHPVAWAQEAQRRGAGEIFLTSIDHEGLQQGYDLALMKAVAGAVDIPVIAFGGAFAWQHLADGLATGVEAVAAANVFHYTEHSTKKAKEFLRTAGIDVR